MSTAHSTHPRAQKARRWITILLASAALSAAYAPLSAPAAVQTDNWLPDAPKSMPGWTADFIDNFAGPLNTDVWGRYDGGPPPVGTHSTYRRDNAVTDQTQQTGDGVLQLTTKKTDGAWSSAGLSSGRGFSAAQGKWTVKAKFDRAYGVGYAFLLYPKGGGWPPEVDMIEGTMGGADIMSTFHYGTAAQNLQQQMWQHKVDMTKWHTYGVVFSGDVITYTLDGVEWGAITNPQSPRMPMWIGLQAGVKDCAKSTGECLSEATPDSAGITVDWVAHYQRT